MGNIKEGTAVNPNMHTAHTHPHLEERYFQRMGKSVDDKTKMLQHLPKIIPGQPAPKVLDIGAGGGELSNRLHELGYDVTALDTSKDAINHINTAYPHITTVQLEASQANQLGTNTYDAIICSSILHEVYSYGDNITGPANPASIPKALKAFHQTLKQGGTIIIRDGILPNNWNEQGTITLTPKAKLEELHTYLQLSPYINRTPTTTGQFIPLHQTDEPRTYKGTIQALLEFAYTYTWGTESYPRETQEQYALYTETQYTQILENIGYTVTAHEQYLQEGYPTHLNPYLTLNTSAGTNQWFNTNAIWVAHT